MVSVQRMTSELEPSFSACCLALNAEVAGLGTTLAQARGGHRLNQGLQRILPSGGLCRAVP